MEKIEQEVAFLDKKRKGYELLKDAIKLVAQKNGKASLYKEVFPKIGEIHKKSAESVERDIRYLLKKCKCPISSKKFIVSVAKKII